MCEALRGAETERSLSLGRRQRAAHPIGGGCVSSRGRSLVFSSKIQPSELLAGFRWAEKEATFNCIYFPYLIELWQLRSPVFKLIVFYYWLVHFHHECVPKSKQTHLLEILLRCQLNRNVAMVSRLCFFPPHARPS